jgi:uroporphyrinogen decarboxylase
MRQAGRYLPEYREIREKYDFLTMCRQTELISEISLQPWRRFGMDAVIVFSDILLPLQAMGPKLTFEENRGPKFEYPVTTKKIVDELLIPEVRLSFRFLLEAIENLQYEIKEDAALLGFIGAPWTLAVYLIEGGSGDFQAALNILRDDPSVVEALMDKITTTTAALAVEQVRAGADAIQIFDTWAGLLTSAQYRQHALPYLRRVIEEIQKVKVPVILFIKKSAALLDEMISSGADVVSVGSDIHLPDVLGRIGDRTAFQGNLDPEILLRSPSTVERETQRLLDSIGNRSGYIANLGHGVLPQTPVESVKAFVETVKSVNTYSLPL